MTEFQTSTLDAEILALIRAWERSRRPVSENDFRTLALQIFEHQRSFNAPYRAYCAALGYADRLPEDWREIPAVPAAGFKEAVLTTFDPVRAAVHFETSGTSGMRSGSHLLETTALYDASLEAGFRDAFEPQGAIRFFHLVPPWNERPRSSLSYMLSHLTERFGARGSAWFARGPELLLDECIGALRATSAEKVPVLICTTAFALDALLDRLAETALQIALPAGSRVMETGGFKGRSHALSQEDLYAAASSTLGIPCSTIVSEYGMTELCSQYYDARPSRASFPRVKTAPPWLRTYVVDGAGRPCADSQAGQLVHVDLANRSSVLALSTDDIGYACADGIVLCGRVDDAPPRGCSLDAEALLQR